MYIHSLNSILTSKFYQYKPIKQIFGTFIDENKRPQKTDLSNIVNLADPELKPKSTFIIPHQLQKEILFNKVDGKPREQKLVFNYIDVDNSNENWQEISLMIQTQ